MLRRDFTGAGNRKYLRTNAREYDYEHEHNSRGN